VLEVKIYQRWHAAQRSRSSIDHYQTQKILVMPIEFDCFFANEIKQWAVEGNEQ